MVAEHPRGLPSTSPWPSVGLDVLSPQAGPRAPAIWSRPPTVAEVRAEDRWKFHITEDHRGLFLLALGSLESPRQHRLLTLRGSTGRCTPWEPLGLPRRSDRGTRGPRLPLPPAGPPQPRLVCMTPPRAPGQAGAMGTVPCTGTQRPCLSSVWKGRLGRGLVPDP